VHFSLMRYKKYINIRDHIIGGWAVQDATKPYLGCMVKGKDRRCATSGLIFNSGSIGAR